MEKTFPLEHARYLFDEAEKYGLYIQTYDQDDKILTTRDGEELQYYVSANRKALNFEICENVCETLGCNPYKVLLIDMKKKGIVKFWEEHKAWEKGRCESTFSTKQFLEYMPMGVSKGHAVKKMCEMLGVDIQNAYAAGDERNDISMIEVAGVGIAMKNASDEVKMVADYVTENDNDHDGIAEVIERLIL